MVLKDKKLTLENLYNELLNCEIPYSKFTNEDIEKITNIVRVYNIQSESDYNFKRKIYNFLINFNPNQLKENKKVRKNFKKLNENSEIQNFGSLQKAFQLIIDDLDNWNNRSEIKVATFYYNGTDYICFWNTNGNNPTQAKFNRKEYIELKNYFLSLYNLEIIEDYNLNGRTKTRGYTWKFNGLK